MAQSLQKSLWSRKRILYSLGVTGVVALVSFLANWSLFILPAVFLVTLFGLFLTNRFFYAFVAVVLVFVLSYFLKFPLWIGWAFFAALVGVTFYDTFLLFQKNGIEAERDFADKLSNGDQNEVLITVTNNYSFPIRSEVIDEVPEQLQQRAFDLEIENEPEQIKSITYGITPKKRGVYTFNHLNVLVQTKLFGLVRRHYQFFEPVDAIVYPSIIQMKKYEFLAISNNLREYGIKKLRRIGQSQEFEQIREYVIGDDYRTINWKATGRKHDLMVNEFIDERSQRVYSIIDKGRVMKMPFEEMTLLDYSINASLAISNIVIKHQNRPGLITFSKQIDSYLPAHKRASQMNRILELLYAQKTNYQESNYEELFRNIRKKVTQRSLLLFFTNFETLNSLYRQIKYLRSLSKKHVLVVIFFKNTELEKIITNQATNVEEIYTKTIGKKYAFEKELIVTELNKYGIHTILTSPQDLTINTINKYLELRSRGLIN